ncbi:TAXI family TRAP transporter solute-binding subunit [Thalassospira sp. HF15]|uniref:TAXI family TRAP transporter solute-binding subunit n=1 Tax=Thalassospira sp. HF15 TaxID=2722755 RepID=UPI001432077F|nr:TAXI family TRAP transporter solute-binding subunit [Thalassospira sp. HF15]NIY74053.1 TAXI family TRAP transporter solute-binding subunit [Thalassospira sp. HF15]
MKLSKLALAGVLAFGLSVPAFAQEKLLIGSTSASSSHYGYFVSVAKLINDADNGIEASVVETGATMDNLRRIQRDQIDLGLVTTNVAQHAHAGTNSFDGNAMDGLGLLWVYTGAPQNVIVREDSGITSLSDLADKRFNPGIKGSATESTSEAVFEALGLSADYVRGSTTDVVDMIKDNRVTGYVKSGAGLKLDSSTLDIATFTPIKVLSLTDDQKQALIDKMPDISVVDIPAGAAEGVDAYSTWSFGVGVGAGESLSEDAAYKIVDAIMSDKEVQGTAMASVKGVNLAELTLQYATIPLHPGAAKWFRENGYDIPAKLDPSK